MGGSLFAGTDEAPGEIIEVDGAFFKHYNGSTSREEKLRQLAKYEAHKHERYSLHIKGVEAMTPTRGPVAEILEAPLRRHPLRVELLRGLKPSELHERANSSRLAKPATRKVKPTTYLSAPDRLFACRNPRGKRDPSAWRPAPAAPRQPA